MKLPLQTKFVTRLQKNLNNPNLKKGVNPSESTWIPSRYDNCNKAPDSIVAFGNFDDVPGFSNENQCCVSLTGTGVAKSCQKYVRRVGNKYEKTRCFQCN